MKVLFGMASTGFKNNEQAYYIIQKAIKDCGHTPYFEGQVETLAESLGDKEIDKQDWSVLCHRELKAAQECDIAIFDVTNKASFGIGYMAAICLARAVPTLFLLQKGSMGGSFISGLEHPNLEREYYDDKNIHGAVSSFLKERAC